MLTVNQNVDKKNVFKDGKSQLIYQDITAEDLMVLYRTNQSKGEMSDEDTAKFTIACMVRMVVDWKGVKDNKTGKAVPFDKELVRGINPKGVIRFFTEVLLPQMQAWGMTDDSDVDAEMGNS